MKQYFLGANTPQGFFSLYDQLEDLPRIERIWYIKGGPGNGKSTFMRTIALAAEKAGHPVEHVPCSGDPSSLDAIVLPEERTVYVDATAPHVREPSLPGAVGRYLDLSAFYRSGASKQKTEIEELYRAYRAEYGRCYELLQAASLASSDRIPGLGRDKSVPAVEERAADWCAENLTDGEGYTLRRFFLSACTCAGTVFFPDTAAETGRVVALDSALGYAPVFLARAARECRLRGVPAVECPDPLSPDDLEALLLPTRKLALLSLKKERPFSGKIWRRIRLDDLADKDALSARRTEFRECAMLRAGLLRQAGETLRNAKKYHDQLEALYHPYVDFRGISSLCRKHIVRLGLTPAAEP